MSDEESYIPGWDATRRGLLKSGVAAAKTAFVYGAVMPIASPLYSTIDKRRRAGENLQNATKKYSSELTEPDYEHSLTSVNSDAFGLESFSGSELEADPDMEPVATIKHLEDGVGSADSWELVTILPMAGNYTDLDGLNEHGMMEGLERDMSEIVRKSDMAIDDFLGGFDAQRRSDTEEQIEVYTWYFDASHNGAASPVIPENGLQFSVDSAERDKLTSEELAAMLEEGGYEQEERFFGNKWNYLDYISR